MKKTQTKNILSVKNEDYSLTFAIMIIFLLCGIAVGCISSKYYSFNEQSFFYDANLLEIAENGVSRYSTFRSYWTLVKYPVITFLLGFTAFGTFFIPIIVSIKGFFVSFSVSFIVQALGIKGFFAAMAILGIQTIIVIPALLITAVSAFEMSKLFVQFFKPTSKLGIHSQKSGRYILLFLIICLSLFLFTLVDVALTPTLISLAIKM